MALIGTFFGKSAAVLVMTLVGGTFLLKAQGSTGEIQLEVKDPSGATMGARGTLRNLGSGQDVNFQTDARGRYRFRGLPYGRYRLEVSKTGFATQSTVVNVDSGTPVSRIVRMLLAAQASKIDVVAPTALPGTDLSLDDIPAPIQTASARNLEQTGSLTLADLLNRRLS